MATASTTAIRKEAAKRGVRGASKMTREQARQQLQLDYALKVNRDGAAKAINDARTFLSSNVSPDFISLGQALLRLRKAERLDLDVQSKARLKKAIEVIQAAKDAPAWGRRAKLQTRTERAQMVQVREAARSALIGK
jgi:hypothetical protein